MLRLRKWLQPGLYIKRWLLLMVFSLTLISVGFAYFLVVLFVEVSQGVDTQTPPIWFRLLTLSFLPVWLRVIVPFGLGVALFVRAILGLNQSLLGPLLPRKSFSEWADLVFEHHQLRQGIRVVAIGGGTGMPSILRAMKDVTNNITAVVTMADDGGSSGRLRREMGMQPPGDLRNNIAALARDEDLMGQLLNYRFERGELSGHTFGNLFLAALADTQGGMDKAAIAAGRVLAIQGQVIPCTTEDVNLVADIQDRRTQKFYRVKGESSITGAEGVIQRIYLDPPSVRAHPKVRFELLRANLIVLGPGSLYTSVLPNLLVHGVIETMRTSNALKVYVCNIATQPGETENFTVADHVLALEKHVGVGFVDIVIANNHYPTKNAGVNTIYVQAVPEQSPVNEHYRVIYTDLTDDERPWRHSSAKLHKTLLNLPIPTTNINVDFALESDAVTIL